MLLYIYWYGAYNLITCRCQFEQVRHYDRCALTTRKPNVFKCRSMTGLNKISWATFLYATWTLSVPNGADVNQLLRATAL